MIPKSVLRDVILQNEEHILKDVGTVVPREGLEFPKGLKKVTVLYGVRRSGKTFVLYDMFLKNKGRTLHVDFEDDRLDDFEVGDFERLRESFFELKPDIVGEPAVFLLDEIQNAEGWEKFCRRLAEKENISVFVSGSSSKLMSSEMHTALRGRSWGVELFPFSFREYLTARGFDVTDRSLVAGRGKVKAKAELVNYLKWGGFPEVACLKSDAEKSKVIREYLGAMFFKDLVERYDITNIPLLDSLMDALLSSASLKFSLLSFYKRYRDRFPFSKDLMYEYYKYFLESMLVFEARIYSSSSYKRSRNPPKIYLVDTGISKRVGSSDIGRLLENAVFLEYRRRGFELFHHAEGNECDFVVKDHTGKLSCVQACFEINRETKSREVAGLTQACMRLGLRRGMILTYDDEATAVVDGVRIDILPFWKWAIVSGM